LFVFVFLCVFFVFCFLFFDFLIFLLGAQPLIKNTVTSTRRRRVALVGADLGAGDDVFPTENFGPMRDAGFATAHARQTTNHNNSPPPSESGTVLGKRGRRTEAHRPQDPTAVRQNGLGLTQRALCVAQGETSPDACRAVASRRSQVSSRSLPGSHVQPTKVNRT
jgi:hypothetical protein